LIHKGDPGNAHILHTCDVNWCIAPDHLYLGDNLQNAADRKSRGLYIGPRGERNGHSKLDTAKIDEMKRLRAEGLPQKTLAERFGVNQSQISRVLRGERWHDLNAKPPLRGHRWLEITAIRVERIQDISDNDCEAEGVRPASEGNGFDWRDNENGWHRTYRQHWDSLHGHGSWDVNPWVWVLTFIRT
jgi:transcriptional regulator with XRE-family HTH domain